MDLKAIYKAQNDKRQADGMAPLPIEDFIEGISFDMCQWLMEHHPEEILQS